LLINLKIHSAYSNFFKETTYTLEATVVYDIIAYLKGVHPEFSKYMKQILSGQSEEPFCLLDSNLKPITLDMIDIKHFKDGETIHLVPAIGGSGGKTIRTLIYAVFAVVAIYFAFTVLGPAMLGPGAPMVAPGVAEAGMVGASASGTAVTGMSILKMAGLQIGLSMVSAMMTKSPAARESKQTESNSRDSGMFGSLTNSSTSGTPIALIYGRHRVAGQFLSGYITTIGHGSGDVISVGSQFDGI
tara:strand:+ start:224 stop:955 length:732 start_codon:yes stop_codon:yes gene_type:complete